MLIFSLIMKFKLPLIILVFVLVLTAAFLSQNLSSKPSSVQSPQKSDTTQIPVSPTQPPLNLQSADEKLEQTDADIQKALTQFDTDLNTVSRIDSAQDSTTGL